MKNFTKIHTILFALIFCANNNLFAQIPANAVNADPAITEIILVPLSANINQTAVMNVVVTNGTADPVNENIPANSISVFIQFPAQYGINAVPAVPNYIVTASALGPSGSLTLRNAVPIPFNTDLNAVFNVVGFSLGSGTTNATVSRTLPLTVGNTQTGNDATFSTFTVVTVLPLKLMSFTGTEKNCNAVLTWVTAQEQNTAYFDVEQGADGSSFKAAGRTAAQGFGAGRTYNYTVTQSDGVSYYRLKMTDADGSYRYSAIVPVRTNCAGNDNYFSVYPNPLTNTNTELTLSFKLSYKGKAQVWITDNPGQRILSRSIVVAGGGNAVKLQTGALMAGSYYLTLADENGKRLAAVQKIVKQ